MLRDARLKVERARKHIDQLEAISRRFLDDEGYEVFVEHDSQGGDDLLRVRATEWMPPEFSLALGDAVHNLRTSLDYAIDEIAFATTGKRAGDVKFPVARNQDCLLAAVESGWKQKIPAPVVDCIVQTIQPYYGGNGEPLAVLHDVDRQDQHQLLLAKAELRLISGISVENDAGQEIPVDIWVLVGSSIAAHPIRGCRNARVRSRGTASYEVVFDGIVSPVVGLKPVIPTVRDLAEFVSGTMDEIEYSFQLSQG
jgi:hypothetical protein